MATNAERIAALERRASKAERRIDALEAAVAATQGRLSTVEAAVVALAARVTALEKPPRPIDPPRPAERAWLSGAAGDGVADGGFAGWRGRPVDIAGTWDDTFEAQTALWTVQPGAEYGAWTGPLDVAVGAIYRDRGETWAAAAAGAFDSRWSACLTTLRELRGDRLTYIRFAHEFNGDWVPWRVAGGDAAHFREGWRRFAGIARRVYPAARLVFCPNDGTSTSLDLDWRTCYPGREWVDVVGVDSYNQYPWVTTPEGFASKSQRVDEFGAPIGVEQHRLFAQAAGLPFAVCEWSSNADMGDAPGYMAAVHTWLKVHSGTGPGLVLYEVLFNVGGFGTGQFAVWPTTRQRAAADEYRARWGA